MEDNIQELTPEQTARMEIYNKGFGTGAIFGLVIGLGLGIIVMYIIFH